MGRTRTYLLTTLGLAPGLIPAACLYAQFTFVTTGQIKTSIYANDVALKGAYAYVSYEPVGLCIYDVSRPSNPSLVAKTNNPGSAEGLVLSGNYVYLATYTDGLRIYDISNPTNAVNVSHIYNGGSSWNLALSGNYLYLAHGGDGPRIYDGS